MPSKSKDVKVEISVEQRDLELTTYKVSVTVPTNEAMVMEWLANQGAIESLDSHLTKAVIDYFQKSTHQVKETFADKSKEQKLANKKLSKKKSKSTPKEESIAD